MEKVDKPAVLAFLQQQIDNGEVLPGARSLRDIFKVGSYSTYSTILCEFNEKEKQKREQQLSGVALQLKDLEGKLINALLPLINDRLEQMFKAAGQRMEAPLQSAQAAYKELMVELEEVNKENQRLKEELEKSTSQYERLSTSIASQVEQITKRYESEKQDLIAKFNLELKLKDDTNRKLDQLLEKFVQAENSNQSSSSQKPQKTGR